MKQFFSLYLKWFFETRLGYFLWLLAFNSILFLILYAIWPNFFNYWYFIGAGGSGLILAMGRTNLKWY